MNDSMKEIIKNIIDNAKLLKDTGKTDYDVAKYVHIELGKVIIYDNNYSANYEKNGIIDERNETKLSQQRKQNMLEVETITGKRAQVCKGMAEIYSSILTTVGVKSRVISVLSKEDVDGEIINGKTIQAPEIYSCSFDKDLGIKYNNIKHQTDQQPLHWYCVVETERGDFIQDYLTESALSRIKIEETTMDSEITAGFHKKDEHREIVVNNRQEINDVFKQSVLKNYELFCKTNINRDRAIQFVFRQLNQNIQNFGFEEAKNYIMILANILPRRDFVQKPEVINFVKENKKNCDIVCIYNYDDNAYLLKGGINSSINAKVGKITKEEFKSIEENGFEPRTQQDGIKSKKLQEERQTDKGLLSIKSVVSNAIIQGTLIEDVCNAQNNERSSNAKDISEVSKDE